MYSLEFEPPRWYLCDHSLKVSNLGDPLLSAPLEDWPARGTGISARKAQEEVLETILILNLQTLLRERLHYLCRAGDIWGIQDIAAVDDLGRFHLFELKRDRVGAAVTEQLGMYVLRHLFEPSDRVLDQFWEANLGVIEERWALYLAAALANTRTSNVGRHDVNEWHPSVLPRGGAEPFTLATWGRLHPSTEPAACEWCTEAMIAKAIQVRGVCGVSAGLVRDWAKSTYRELTKQKPLLPRTIPVSRAVFWLVGTDFDPEVYEQVRLWRRAGLDARCVKIDARQSARTGQWVVRMQREAFQERDRALEVASSRIKTAAKGGESGRLDLRFYETRPASDTNLIRGGTPLHGRVEVVLLASDGTQTVLYPACETGDSGAA